MSDNKSPASASASAAPASKAVSTAATAAAAAKPTVDPREAVKWHGIMLAGANLPLPECTYKTDVKARPQYSDITGSEFRDLPEVLDAKVDLLIKLIKESPRTAILNGAGTSISAKSDLPKYADGTGIRDYASKNNLPKSAGLARDLIDSLRPTQTHRTIAAMYKAGILRHDSNPKIPFFLDQCHDGLCVKAGLPKSMVNQLHGSWMGRAERDKNHPMYNPIIKMSGSLRSDLFQSLLDLEKSLTFTLVTGSSLSGLNADRLTHTACQRFIEKQPGQLGSCLISIQQTPHDAKQSLRIFAKLDEVFSLVAEKLKLEIDWTTDYDFDTGAPIKKGLPYWMRGTAAAAGAAGAGAASRSPANRSPANRSPSNRSPSNRSPTNRASSRSPPRMYPASAETSATPPRQVSPAKGAAAAGGK